MPMKDRGASDLREIDRWDHGARWPAYPDETTQRASHAVEVDGDVWLFDPVDAPGVDDLFAEFGGVAGIMVGLDRHKRDSTTLANRHEVSVCVASRMTGVVDELDTIVERFGADSADSGFEVFRLADRSVPSRQGVGFYHDGYDLLVVPELVGAVGYLCARGEHFGAHPMLRSFPPRRVLPRYDPDRLPTGHGAGVPVDAGDEFRTTLGDACRNFPNAYAWASTSMFSN